MDKKRQIAFNLNNFLLSISSGLDAVESDIFNTSYGHSKRIAYISLKLAQEFNYSPEGLFDICAYSLCHNIGLYETLNKDKDYCELSQEYINKFPFLSDEKDILKYQCEYYNGSGIYSLKEDEIPLFSQFISFADTIDSKFDLSNSSISNRNKIISFIEENRNILFSEDIVECFIEFSLSTSFWLELESENDILNFIFGTIQDNTKVLDFEELLEITTVFTKILNQNNKIVLNSEKVASSYSFEHKDKLIFLLSSSLCSLGKLYIPKKITDKKTYLSEEEFEMMKSYPFYTKKILSNIIGFNDILNLCSKVQESLDGEGYPFNFKAKDLSFKDRLLKTILIYTSLTSEKTYRNAFCHDEAISIMYSLVQKKELDESILSHIEKLFK